MTVSLLMLTFNDVQDFAIKNLELTKDFVGEQVVIDSSNNDNKQALKQYAKTNPKLKIYSVLALGTPETTIPYGIAKCNSNWILLLDADEIPCLEFIESLRYMDPDPLSFPYLKPNAEANYILRYENPQKAFATWQLRLFQKGKICYKGQPHEKPIVLGKKERLDPKYYLIHQKLGTVRPYRDDAHYKLMEKVGLYTNESRLRRLAATAYITLRMNPTKILDNIITCIKETQRTPEQKAIAKIIGDNGIITYLGLDKPGELERLTKKYKNYPQGPQLLIDLMEKQYRDNYGSNN